MSSKDDEVGAAGERSSAQANSKAEEENYASSEARRETAAESPSAGDPPAPLNERRQDSQNASPRSTSSTGIADFLRQRYLTLDPRWLGIFRIAFGLLLCSELVARWRYARFYFSNDGVLPNHFSMFAPMGDDLFSIYHIFSTVEEVHVAFAFTLVVFVLFTVGYRTRVFQVLSAILITSLHARNLFLENGGSVVTHSLAIWTVFLPLGTCFSVDALLASFAREKEQSPRDLNQRQLDAPAPFVSIVVLGLLLQWSAIYFFNAVHKSGEGWRNLSAIYYFLYQDRIVTALGIWMREHAPYALLQGLTASTLVVEHVLGVILLVPFGQRWLRRIAFVLALGLHGSIALLSRLGPFSYVMTMFFLMLFGESEFRLLGRWFGRPARAVTVIFDSDCGICLWTCRLLKRLDPFARLTFIGNDQADLLPKAVTATMVEQSVVAIGPTGKLELEERAVRRILLSLPFGFLLAFWLFVPGLSTLARAAYRSVARNRQRISAFFGLGACGVPLSGGAAPFRRVQGSLARDLAGGRAALREMLASVMMVILASEVAKANPYLSRHVHLRRPAWMGDFIGYTRMFEGWGMFAPEPPYEDGRLVVDGRTRDGRKLDPFTGEEPEFDTESPRGWGHDQLWCDYNNHIRWPHNEGRRQFLRTWLINQHKYSGRPDDELVAFDVWFIQDRSPAPGEKHGHPLAPEKLVSYGLVRNSGSRNWQNRKQTQSPRLPTSSPTEDSSGSEP